ncbi:beta strand repeat-containing protein [Geomobilimonas luticola]|uniref:Carboxypeptidase regulatory-like domain-containing protein n=1 Tax=Geomobilimonas luticola TaxID=1114878 RepID=A0ABS5SFU8_9BACT|nr:carboxypeptidase regulatory-like domain-containing protein [Geomobilimonas luticola]MBT0654243.1 carboxypeptidase regulatory-like domain-containing protein [Geomobilimonas luticola]
MKGLRGFWSRIIPVVTFLVLLVGVASAHAWNISGTISNTSGRTGRVYLYLQQQYGGDTGLGLSIGSTAPTWPNFQIRGVPSGSYILKAFVDGSGTGVPHPNDPTWTSPGTITISNGDYTLNSTTTVTFTSRPNVAPVAPAGAMILPGANGAFVGWDEPRDGNGNKIADSYKIYWSTTSSTPKTTNPLQYIAVPGGDNAFALLNVSNGTPLYVQAAALVGTTESAASPVASTTINPPATGVTVSGTVNLSGISAPTGNLYVALVPSDGPPAAVAWVANPPQLSNPFTISGVPDGTYSLYALGDANGDGKIGSGDYMTSDQQALVITVAGSSLTGQTVTLDGSKSSPFLTTSHYQDSNTPPNDSYNVVIGARSMTEVLTNITVTGGPSANGLTYPMDLGISSWGGFQSWLNVNNNRPQATDAYNVAIKYAGITTADTVTLNPTVVLDSFATPTVPQGYFTWPMPDSNPLTFSWTAPASPPAQYTYSMWANIPGFNYNYNNMPSSTLSQSVSGLTINDGSRNEWTISVQDAAGNQAQKSTWFVSTSKPAIATFTPTTVLPGDTVTISGFNFNTTAGNNKVIFGCGAEATAATATATQLTVVVPTNACNFNLQVQDTSTGKTSDNSAAQLNVLQTLQINGMVTDAGTMAGITGATVTASFTLNGTPHTPSTTTSSGNYALNGVVPQNTDFTLGFSATGYAPAYTGTINTNQFNLSQNMALYPAASFTAWNGGDTTTGVIRGRVYDATNTANGVAGVAVSSTSGTVMYDNGSGTPVAGTSTGANGVFYITHLLGSATVTAAKTGYQINSVMASGYAGAVTNVDMPAASIISVSGSVIDNAGNLLGNISIEQLGSTNTATSAPDGTFTLNNIPSSGFELRMSQGATYVPVYTGWLNSPSNVTLPYSYRLLTPTEVSTVLGVTTGKGAILGRLVNSANLAVAISGGTVTAYGPSPSYVVRYFDSVTGQFTGTTATDASGMFLVRDVEDGANIGINANIGTGGNGFLNVTTHAPGVSEIAVQCNVPQVAFSWLTSPSAITVTTTTSTPNIYGQVTVWNVTTAGPGPVAGLVGEVGYGPQGTDPSSPSWIWKTATYNTQQGGNHEYVTNLSVTTAGSYDYAYRFSYFGGPYVYGDLTGSNDGYSSANAGKLTVNPAAGNTAAKIGIFSDGYWYLDANQSWAWDGTPTDKLGLFGLGIAGAIPVVGDWNGDGKTEIGVFVDGIWYLDMNGNGQWDGEGIDVMGMFGVGVSNAIPVVGDWNGDGKTKIGIYADGIWYLDMNQNWAWDGEGTDVRGVFGVGLPNAKPVVGDWTGDHITKIGVYSDGNWFLDKNHNWAWDGAPTDTFGVFGVGLSNAVPVTGDWTGDGITKIGIYSEGNWFLDKSNNWAWDGEPTDIYGMFGVGLGNAVPVVGNW